MDTPENRRRAAERYLQVVTPEDLMRDTAEKVATNLPETKRKRLLDAMTKRLDFETINQRQQFGWTAHLHGRVDF